MSNVECVLSQDHLCCHLRVICLVWDQPKRYMIPLGDHKEQDEMLFYIVIVLDFHAKKWLNEHE